MRRAGRRDSQVLEAEGHDLLEHRRRELTTEVAVARILQEDCDDEARCVSWRHTDEGGGVAAVATACVIDAVGGSRLSGDPVARDGGLGCRAVAGDD